MTASLATIHLQTPAVLDRIGALHKQAFGPGRFARTAYRIRETAYPDNRLNLYAELGGEVVGAVHFTPIVIGQTNAALLLGPLVIGAAHKNQGHGLRLMLEGLARAETALYRVVVLVGDEPYYARAGFARVPRGQFGFPGPVDPDRILLRELVPGATNGCRGMIRGSIPV